MKKILIPIVAVFLVALLIVGATYSFFVAGSSGNNGGSVANSIGYNIIFTKGANLIGDIEPSISYDENRYVSANVRVSTNSAMPSVDVYINIESISQNLGISALKWKVEATKGGNSVTLSSTTGDFASCSHNNVTGPCQTGDKIYVARDYVLDTVDTLFKVYIWLDGNMISTNISDAVLNASLGAETRSFTGVDNIVG